jgi:hypothetical protein
MLRKIPSLITINIPERKKLRYLYHVTILRFFFRFSSPFSPSELANAKSVDFRRVGADWGQWRSLHTLLNDDDSILKLVFRSFPKQVFEL